MTHGSAGGGMRICRQHNLNCALGFEPFYGENLQKTIEGKTYNDVYCLSDY